MKKSFAKVGRLPKGQMNKVEAKYALILETLKRNGNILEYYYEPLKFRLGDNCYYTPDFMIIDSNGIISFEEIKGGYITDDSIIKWKMVVEKYPYFNFRMIQYNVKNGYQIIRNNDN